MKKNRVVSSAVSVLVSTNFALTNIGFAMPKFGSATNSVASKSFLSDPLLKGTQLFRDHEDPTKYYISPSVKKVKAGNFYLSATPACGLLKRTHDMVYLLPNIPLEHYQDFAESNPFYSPYFYWSYGHFYKFQNLFLSAYHKNSEYQVKLDNYKDELAEYQSAQKKYEIIKEELSEIQNEKNRMEKQEDIAREEIYKSDDREKRAELREVLNDLKSQNRERLTYLRQKQRDIERRLDDASEEKIRTHRQLTKKNPDFEFYMNRIKAIKSSVDQINDEIHKNWSKQLENLNEMQDKTVGYAVAAVSVWGEEESKARDILTTTAVSDRPYRQSINVARLPIFDVIMKTPGRSKFDFGFETNKSTMTFERLGQPESSTWVGTGNIIADDKSVFEQHDLKRTEYIRDATNSSSEAVRIPISMQHYCSSGVDEVSFSIQLPEIDRPVSVTRRDFRMREHSSIIDIPYVFDYKYYVAIDPVDVQCTLKEEEFRNYVAKQGSSGFWLWKKNYRDTSSTEITSSGVSCEVNSQAPGADTGKLRLLADRYSDLLKQEYIAKYAKSYKVTSGVESMPDISHSSNSIGDAIGGVCGVNPYCKIGSVIFKSAPEIFGGRGGQSSSTEKLKRTLYRNYREKSYIVQEDSSEIMVTVSR